MANDADLRSLTKAVKGVEDQLKDMNKVLKVLNENFMALIIDFRTAQSQEGTHFKVDEAYLRDQPPEQWVDPEEQNGR